MIPNSKLLVKSRYSLLKLHHQDQDTFVVRGTAEYGGDAAPLGYRGTQQALPGAMPFDFGADTPVAGAGVDGQRVAVSDVDARLRGQRD